MTEKLTYDPTPADAPEFNESEQEALEVAEKLGQEENELLAGKYKNAEDLEEAYLELQKKLGSDDDDSEVDTEETEEEDTEWSDGAALIASASSEFYENEGQLTPETMQKFSEMSSQDLVEAFMEIQRNNPTPSPSGDTFDLTDAEMNSIYNSAGGEVEYGKLTAWASENLSEDKMNAFNSVVNN